MWGLSMMLCNENAFAKVQNLIIYSAMSTVRIMFFGQRVAAWELSIPLLCGNQLMSVPFCLDVPLIGLFVGFFVFAVVQVF